MNFLQKLEANWLLAPKLTYLLVNLQFYGFHQLRSVFAKDKFNVSDEEYGKFTGYTQFLTFFTSILIGNFSDKTKKYKPILIFLLVISTVFFFHFYIDTLMGIHPWMFWVFIFLYLVSNNPKAPLLDKIIIGYLEDTSSAGPKVYGKQRLWGTISLSLATYICEWCTSNGDGTYSFEYLIHYNVIATILAIICVFFLINNKSQEPVHRNKLLDRQVEIQNSNKYMAFLELFKNKEFMFFILIIFSNAITRSALTIYLNRFHKDILNIRPYNLPKSWPGSIKSPLEVINQNPIATLTTFGIVFEMIVMFVADKVIDRLGYFWPLIIAQIISVVRFLAYYVMSSSNDHVYALSCLFELLRGIYFGMIHISSVHIAPKLAPPHLKATSQMMYQATFSALGSLISGQLFGNMLRPSEISSFDEKEAIYRLIFLINTAIALITVVICIIKYGFIDGVLFSRQKENAKLNSYERPIKA